MQSQQQQGDMNRDAQARPAGGLALSFSRSRRSKKRGWLLRRPAGHLFVNKPVAPRASARLRRRAPALRAAAAARSRVNRTSSGDSLAKR